MRAHASLSRHSRSVAEETFGLLHCRLCPCCLRKLQLATGFGVKDRYKGLARQYESFGWSQEEQWASARAAEIGSATAAGSAESEALGEDPLQLLVQEQEEQAVRNKKAVATRGTRRTATASNNKKQPRRDTTGAGRVRFSFSSLAVSSRLALEPIPEVH